MTKPGIQRAMSLKTTSALHLQNIRKCRGCSFRVRLCVCVCVTLASDRPQALVIPGRRRFVSQPLLWSTVTANCDHSVQWGPPVGSLNISIRQQGCNTWTFLFTPAIRVHIVVFLRSRILASLQQHSVLGHVQSACCCWAVFMISCGISMTLHTALTPCSLLLLRHLCIACTKPDRQ